MNSKDRNNKSLCENSMKMMVNMIKLSSFSIAKMSLGAAGASTATKDAGPVVDSLMPAPLLSQFSGSQRSEKPQNSSKPVSFMMEPNKGNESSYVVLDEKSAINGLAAAYIRKVHQKNRNAFSETSNLPPHIPPPPPRAII